MRSRSDGQIQITTSRGSRSRPADRAFERRDRLSRADASANTPVDDVSSGNGFTEARTGMPPGIPGGAMCVQRFDDSLNSAIHITYRISLRSSSMREPRDPLLKVLTFFLCFISDCRLGACVFVWTSPERG